MHSIFIDNFEKLEEGLFSANVGPHTEYHFRSEAMPKHGWGVASFFYDESKTAWHVRRIDLEGYNKSAVPKHPKINIARYRDEKVRQRIQRASTETVR